MALGSTDAGPSWRQSIGISGARFTSANQSASAAPVTSAPATGEKQVIDDLIVSVDTAMTLTFTEETSGTVLLTAYLPANFFGQVTTRGKLKLANANRRLQVQSSASGNVSVTALWHSEP